MADSAETFKAFVKKTINLKVTGTTILIEARAGKKFLVRAVIVSRSSYSGASGTNAAISVGNDVGGNYTNVIDGDGGAKALFFAGGSTAEADGVDLFVPSYQYCRLIDISTEAIRFNVQSASTWTTDVATVIIEGYYI